MVRDVERVLLLGQSECQAQTAAISVEVERAETALADSVSGLEKDRVEVNRLADEKVSQPHTQCTSAPRLTTPLPHASHSHSAPLPCLIRTVHCSTCITHTSAICLLSCTYHTQGTSAAIYYLAHRAPLTLQKAFALALSSTLSPTPLRPISQ